MIQPKDMSNLKIIIYKIVLIFFGENIAKKIS